jgi:hypothetical protein
MSLSWINGKEGARERERKKNKNTTLRQPEK